MARVIADMSMSLDGYIADADDGVKEVFAWLGSGAPDNAAIIEESMADVGAVLTGRRTSDLAKAWRGQHPAGVPTYVVTHRPPPDDLDAETSTVFFVDDLEEAVRQAKDTAGDKAVAVAGGDVVRQLLALGLLNEIRISLVPVLLGQGVAYFPDLADAPVALEAPIVTAGTGVTRLLYRVAA